MLCLQENNYDEYGTYQCQDQHFFEIGSVPHKHYLVNINLPGQGINTNCLAGHKHFLSGMDFVVSLWISFLFFFLIFLSFAKVPILILSRFLSYFYVTFIDLERTNENLQFKKYGQKFLWMLEIQDLLGSSFSVYFFVLYNLPGKKCQFFSILSDNIVWVCCWSISTFCA